MGGGNPIPLAERLEEILAPRLHSTSPLGLIPRQCYFYSVSGARAHNRERERERMANTPRG